MTDYYRDDEINTDELVTSDYLLSRLFSNWLYYHFGRWNVVGDFFDVHKATAWRVANDEDYTPKDYNILKRFGVKSIAKVVTVNGRIPSGSQALGALVCACGQPFISNHPRRRKCFICSEYRGKRRS